MDISTKRREQGHENSRTSLAYQKIRDALISLRFKPGDYLNMAELTHQFELGRTPINHALHRLANEGLVMIMPRKGVIVSPLSIDEALDLVEVRIANEKLCMQLAAQKITSANIDALRALADACNAAAESHDMTRMMNADRAIHDTLAHLSGNRTLAELLIMLHARSLRFWAVTLSAPGHLQEVRNEHAELIDALEKHDVDAAVNAAETHILSFKAALLGQRGIH